MAKRSISHQHSLQQLPFTDCQFQKSPQGIPPPLLLWAINPFVWFFVCAGVWQENNRKRLCYVDCIWPAITALRVSNLSPIWRSILCHGEITQINISLSEGAHRSGSMAPCSSSVNNEIRRANYSEPQSCRSKDQILINSRFRWFQSSLAAILSVLRAAGMSRP